MLPGPVFNVELITTARRARYYAIRFVYGMILLFFVVQAATEFDWRRGAAIWSGEELSIKEMAKTGQRIFSTFAVLQGIAVVILTPALVAGVVADEKRRKTLHYLLASRLNAAEIILGKLLARLLQLGVFLAIGLPVMSLISLFGGVEPLVVVLVYGATVSTAWFIAALAILVSTLARRPREANAQVYLLVLAWLLCPQMVAWLMPFAGGIWAKVYQWLRPVNDMIRWSSPASLFGPSTASDPVGAFLWMVGLQSAYALGFIGLAIVLLRPIFRREGEEPRMLGWLAGARRGRRLLPRPEVGDDAMLWKERYVSRTSAVVKIASGLVFLLVAAVLGYATYQWAEPAFREFWEFGYGTSGNYVRRQDFNGYLRFLCTLVYSAWCLGVASLASAGVVAEREEDTWTSLITTPLSGEEILRAKMIGAIWGTRWLGFILIAAWLVGVALGSVHPFGLVAVAIETTVFIWFVAALGVWISVTAKSSVRAQTATMTVLVVLNGAYLLCCIPLDPDSMIVAIGVTPMIEALSLFSYQDVSQGFVGRGEANAVFTCIFGVLFYGAAAFALTLRAFTAFDEKIGRPRRSWPPPQDARKIETIRWTEVAD
jgi:ABC-type transport system involved in multi-copper enzyme maturation permease subunit